MKKSLVLIATMAIFAQSTLYAQEASTITTCDLINIKKEELAQKLSQVEEITATYKELEKAFQDAKSRDDQFTKILMPTTFLGTVGLLMGIDKYIDVLSGWNWFGRDDRSSGAGLIILSTVVTGVSVTLLVIENNRLEEARKSAVEAMNTMQDLSKQLDAKLLEFEVLSSKANCQ